MSVRWKKRDRKNRRKNEMVLKGLEEQRLKALKEASVSEMKEKKNRKEVGDYVFDEEKKRYFPKSVYREGMSVIEWWTD